MLLAGLLTGVAGHSSHRGLLEHLSELPRRTDWGTPQPGLDDRGMGSHGMACTLHSCIRNTSERVEITDQKR